MLIAYHVKNLSIRSHFQTIISDGRIMCRIYFQDEDWNFNMYIRPISEPFQLNYEGEIVSPTPFRPRTEQEVETLGRPEMVPGIVEFPAGHNPSGTFE